MTNRFRPFCRGFKSLRSKKSWKKFIVCDIENALAATYQDFSAKMIVKVSADAQNQHMIIEIDLKSWLFPEDTWNDSSQRTQ